MKEFRHRLGSGKLSPRLFVFLFSYYVLLHGEPPPASHTLGDILSFTLLNNPELTTYSYDMRAGDAKILQASLRPNPGFDVESENINTPEFRQTTFLLSQLFELGGKR